MGGAWAERGAIPRNIPLRVLLKDILKRLPLSEWLGDWDSLWTALKGNSTVMGIGSIHSNLSSLTPLGWGVAEPHGILWGGNWVRARVFMVKYIWVPWRALSIAMYCSGAGPVCSTDSEYMSSICALALQRAIQGAGLKDHWEVWPSSVNKSLKNLIQLH